MPARRLRMTKTLWGPRKGEIDMRTEVKNERFFVGVVSLLRGRLNSMSTGESVLYVFWRLLLAVAPLRTGLNSKDGERLHYVIYYMAARLVLMPGGLSGGHNGVYSLKHFFTQFFFKNIPVSVSEVEGLIWLSLFSLRGISLSSYAEVRLHCELMLGLFVLSVQLCRGSWQQSLKV